MRVTVLGGTGYAGSHIAREAAARGHEVTVVSRHAPDDAAPGVGYATGDVRDPAVLRATVRGADVVVGALSPRADMRGEVAGVVRALADAAREAGVRIGVVGGAGSLQVAPGGPALAETDSFPAEFRAEASEMAGVLADLRASAEDLDWFFVSPAAEFGPWQAGEHTGTFRVGDDVLLVDEQGRSAISGADLAHAVVDEIERPTHRRRRFTVAY